MTLSALSVVQNILNKYVRDFTNGASLAQRLACMLVRSRPNIDLKFDKT